MQESDRSNVYLGGSGSQLPDHESDSENSMADGEQLRDAETVTAMPMRPTMHYPAMYPVYNSPVAPPSYVRSQLPEHFYYPPHIYSPPFPVQSSQASVAPPLPEEELPAFKHSAKPVKFHLDTILSLKASNVLEKDFGVGLFRGLYYTVDPDRREFQWPERRLTNEERLLVLFNCMRKLGFDTLGLFLRTLFRRDYPVYTSVSRTIQSFLSADSPNAETHPVSIVDAIFRHVKSERWSDKRRIPIHFTVPQYALPPSKRLLPPEPIPKPPSNSTRGALLNWAFERVVEQVDSESTSLTRLSILKRMPKEVITWTSVLNWSIVHVQEVIATTAPVVFTVLCTISVNQDIRKRLRRPDTPTSRPLHRPDTTSTATSAPQEEPLLPEPVNIDDDDDAPTISLESGVPKRTRRDPWLSATIALLCLLYMRYRYMIVFPSIVGLFLFTCGTNRDTIVMLSRFGLTVSYSTILGILHTLAADSSARLKMLGEAVKVGQPIFQFLFDNVNKMRRAWEQVLGHRDEVKSGTASTVIELEDVPDGALDHDKLEARIKEQKRREMTFEKLLEDIDWEHIEGIGTATLLRTWVNQIPPLNKFKPNVETMFKVTHSLHPLRLRKSRIHTLRPTNIDESSTAGVLQVVQNLVSQLGIAVSSLTKWVFFFCGDQLSIDRLRHVKMYMGKAEGHERYSWVMPVIQLWHMKWAWQKAIFRTHWSTVPSDAGLRYDTYSIFRRDKFNHEKCDFYHAHHILEDRFVAMILEALRSLCEEKSKISYLSNVRLTDCLERYFSTGGPLDGCTFEELVELAETVYQRYLCSAAYTDTISGYRPEETYGPAPVQPADEDQAKSDDLKQSEPDCISARKAVRTNRAKAQEKRNVSTGDQLLANEINFLRMTFWYLEMCAGISEGDIGRVFAIIKLLRFSFWGVGSTNYANELLEQACNFLCDFPEDLVTAILNNYLVNTSGLPGKWFELDLLQEHLNFWLKRLFNSKSHEFDSRHLSEAVGLNIWGFSSLREHVPRMFGVRGNAGKHTNSDRRADINALGKYLRSRGVLKFSPSRSHPYSIDDEFGRGMDQLREGIASFVERTLEGGPQSSVQLPHTGEEPETSDGESENQPSAESELPANPLELSDGMIETRRFDSKYPE
ncbi:hypothetical protein V5O48_007454 [Marasmius crinis-equi]|uniref:DUF6589 domain-containing protein n=1 Tax=Marasmius crinis-equi TaxID=585013 RepID=A0ABR3FHD5_9AGAR